MAVRAERTFPIRARIPASAAGPLRHDQETPMRIPSLREVVTAEEWQLRCDLAAAYRLVAAFGWTDLIFTHLTARLPGPEHHFLINPYGLAFDEITASSLVKIDLEGNPIGATEFPVNRAGFVIHSAIHAAREDVCCVIHTHTRAGAGVSAQKGGLLPISQQSTFVLPFLGYHDYEGVAVRPDEQPRLQKNLGHNQYLILRNHGLLTVGRTVADAFLAMYVLETACQIQIAAQSGGADLNLLRQEQIDINRMPSGTGTMGAKKPIETYDLAWPAMLRKVERLDPSYRT
jgi:ribulose-5-phosphate 4-epimerase/fuculose-1-phosphate aldolase